MAAEKFSNGVRIVSATAMELRNAIIELAGNRAVFDSRARWLDRAARVAGITPRTAKALFYCETPDPKSSVVEKVREAQSKKRAANEKLRAEAQNEYAELISRIERIEAALSISDADFNEPQITALREMARRSDKPLA